MEAKNKKKGQKPQEIIAKTFSIFSQIKNFKILHVLAAVFFVIWILIGIFVLLLLADGFKRGAYQGLFGKQSQEQQTQAPQMPPAQVKSSPNMMLVIILVVIIIAAVLGGVYYISMSAPAPTTETTAPQAPVAMQEKTADSGLEGELNAIEIESNDSAFADVDKDLQSL